MLIGYYNGFLRNLIGVSSESNVINPQGIPAIFWKHCTGPVIVKGISTFRFHPLEVVPWTFFQRCRPSIVRRRWFFGYCDMDES